MSNLTWLLQSNLVHYDQSLPFLQAVKENNQNWEEFIMIPFTDHIETAHSNYIPYGSVNLVKRLSTSNLVGLHFNENNSKVSTWIKNRSDLLNQEAVILPLSQAIDILENSEEYFFIKPDNDLKDFAGSIVKGKNLSEWIDTILESPKSYREQNQNIVISEPKKIISEYRCFVIGSKVVDVSRYRAYGKPVREHLDNIPVEISILSEDWIPSTCTVMDVAYVNKRYKVIEFNCINCSGTYHNDINKITRSWYNYIERNMI